MINPEGKVHSEDLGADGKDNFKICLRKMGFDECGLELFG
jgi:hypothetical protein